MSDPAKLIPVSGGACLRCGHEIDCPFCPRPWCHRFDDEGEEGCACGEDNQCEMPEGAYEAWSVAACELLRRLNTDNWPPFAVWVVRVDAEAVEIEGAELDGREVLAWAELRARAASAPVPDETNIYRTEAYRRALAEAERLLAGEVKSECSR